MRLPPYTVLSDLLRSMGNLECFVIMVAYAENEHDSEQIVTRIVSNDPVKARAMAILQGLAKRSHETRVVPLRDIQ